MICEISLGDLHSDRVRCTTGFPRQKLFGFEGLQQLAPGETVAVSLRMPTAQQVHFWRTFWLHFSVTFRSLLAHVLGLFPLAHFSVKCNDRSAERR